jgi:WS/DGAT/MGAT family acyltransferase
MATVALADRLFLAVESDETPQHVACLAVFTPPPDAGPEYLQKLEADMRAVTTVASPFNLRLRRQRLRTIAPAWDTVPDEEIDLEHHFRHSALPRPGGERVLGVLVSRLHSRPLDPTRPLWELHLIEGLENGRFAIYLKLHHALMDGAGGIRRIGQMLSVDAADTGVRPLWSIGSGASARTRRNGSVAEQLTALLASVKATAGTVAGLGQAAGQMVRDARDRSDPALAIPFVLPKSVMNEPIGRQRRVATQCFEFARLRAVSKAASVTINDVFLCIVGGGLRRYLDEIGELPAQNLTAGTPVNFRAKGDEDTANAFTVTVMSLGTAVADPAARLAFISRSSTLAKQRLQQLPRSVAELYAALFMGPFIVQNLMGLGGRVTPPYNVSVSNVPGPLEPQYFVGSRMEAMYPLACLYHGGGLFIAVFAASGRFSVGFCGDRDTLPHLQKIAVYTGEALAELEKAVGS